MPLLIVIGACLLVIVMIVAFTRNAITLKRDVDRRFDEFRDRLETEANSTLDAVLTPKSGKDT